MIYIKQKETVTSVNESLGRLPQFFSFFPGCQCVFICLLIDCHIFNSEQGIVDNEVAPAVENPHKT